MNSSTPDIRNSDVNEAINQAFEVASPECFSTAQAGTTGMAIAASVDVPEKIKFAGEGFRELDNSARCTGDRAAVTSPTMQSNGHGGAVGKNTAIHLSGAHNTNITNEAREVSSLWSSSHINFHHKRPNGTFVNGPRLEYEVTGVLVRAVITVAFVAALAASCSWLLNRFLEAETAIIHSISLKGGK